MEFVNPVGKQIVYKKKLAKEKTRAPRMFPGKKLINKKFSREYFNLKNNKIR